MSTPTHPPPREKRRLKAHSVILRVSLALAAIALLAYVGRWFGAELPVFEEWIHGMGLWGPLVYSVLFLALTGLQFPESALAVVAGVAFGMWSGFALILVVNFLGAALWFWVARKLLRKWVQRALERHEKLEAIERATAEEGFRLMVLLRLGPFSFGFLNFMLGASDVRPWPFLFAVVGVIPGNFATVYFGSLANHVARKAAGADNLSSPHFGLMIAGFAVTILVVAIITHVARKALKEVEARQGTIAGA